MIRFEGVLTEAEYAEFADLVLSFTPAALAARGHLLVFGAGLVAIAGWFGATRDPWLAVAPLVAGLAFGGIGWWMLQAPRRAWRKDPAFREPYRGTVAREALDIRLAGTDARLPWAMFDAHKQSRNVVLLRAGNRAIPLARGFFANQGDWEQAIVLAAQAGTGLPAPRAVRAAFVRALILWGVLLLVVYGSWHFTQPRQPKVPPPLDEPAG